MAMKKRALDYDETKALTEQVNPFFSMGFNNNNLPFENSISVVITCLHYTTFCQISRFDF